MARLDNIRACILISANPIDSDRLGVSDIPNIISSIDIIGPTDDSIRSRRCTYTNADSRSLAENHIIVKKFRQTMCTTRTHNTGGMVYSIPHCNATNDTSFSASHIVQVVNTVAAILYADI